MDGFVEPFWVLTEREASGLTDDVKVCVTLLAHPPSQSIKKTIAPPRADWIRAICQEANPRESRTLRDIPHRQSNGEDQKHKHALAISRRCWLHKHVTPEDIFPEGIMTKVVV